MEVVTTFEHNEGFEQGFLLVFNAFYLTTVPMKLVLARFC